MFHEISPVELQMSSQQLAYSYPNILEDLPNSYFPPRWQKYLQVVPPYHSLPAWLEYSS